MTWYVLYTKPRNEKKLAALLAEQGVSVYCPVKEEVKQWSDRRKKVIEPVFKSYIFVQLEDYNTESKEVLQNHGAVKFLWWNDKPGVVRNEEIEAIRNFLDEYRNASINVELVEGQKVVVAEGPLMNKEGKVIRIEGNKAILQLDGLGMNLVAKLPVQSLSINK